MGREGDAMETSLDRIRKILQDEDARYVYADSVCNAFISAQLRELRDDRGMSQVDLAELIGTKQSGISRLEKADYSAWKIDTLRKIARAFHVRLRISFEDFGTLPEDMRRFTAKQLTPRAFEDDPVFKESFENVAPLDSSVERSLAWMERIRQLVDSGAIEVGSSPGRAGMMSGTIISPEPISALTSTASASGFPTTVTAQVKKKNVIVLPKRNVRSNYVRREKRTATGTKTG